MAEETDPPVFHVRHYDLATGYLLPDDVTADMMIFPGQKIEVIQARKGYTQIAALFQGRAGTQTDLTISPLRSEMGTGQSVTSRCSKPLWYTIFLTGLPGTTSVANVSVEFLLTSLVVVLIPGTGVVYTVSSSIGGGRRRGLFAAIGCTLGIVPHMLAAMLGLSGIMQAGSVVFEAVRWAGVAYLVFVGFTMVRDAGTLPLDDQDAPVDSAGSVVWRGILLNVLNPKLTLFFFAFLPQFLDASPGLLDVKLIELGGIFMLMTLAVFAVYALASAAVRDLILAVPAARRWIERSFGAILVGFAAKLAFTER